ncbi:MAG: type VI secretion system contractile sheath large subunit [Myxococcales bacterium]|nr:type VI secretion system contractile sheath large subunit [Myxococcales bacterium]
MAASESADGVRVRWLVAGAFRPSPSGARFKVSPATFGEVLEGAGLRVDVEINDRLGADAKRRYSLSFSSLKAFQVNELVATHPLLKGLSELSQALGQADATKRPEASAAVARVVELVGDGKLAATLRAKLNVTAPAAQGAAPKADAPAASGSMLDELVGAPVAPAAPQTPTAAVSSFIKAMRPSGGTAAVTAGVGRAGRDVLEAELYATAVELLNAPEAAAVERAWRSLKLVVDSAPVGSGMQIEVLDVAAGDAAEALRGALPEVPEEEGPDALFVFDAVNSQEALTTLANLGADADAPVVVSVTEALFGQDVQAVGAKIEADDGSLPAWWSELRADEASRWLAVAFNRPVLRMEGTGSAKRVVFGHASAALAAMLASSYHRSGAFARILGATGALKTGGAYELPVGRDAGMLVPTEAFLSIRAQTRLNELGIIGLGSSRNSDVLVLSAASTVRGGSDLVPLSAQVLTGRIVRFARWVLAQLPAGAEEAEVKLLFEQASEVFLFPSARESARLEAQVVAAEGGARQVVLQVSARADLAGIPFHLGFALPLKG